MEMTDCVIDGPKFFREMRNLKLRNVTINDADETFWNIDGLHIDNVVLHEGTYPFMGCRNVVVNNLRSDSKYVFQYVRDVEIHHAHIVTKDSFWEVENVTIYDSYLDGEYLGWHSKNLRLVKLVRDIAGFLRVPVVAEGVEEKEQLKLLKRMGCDIVQGYYFSPPLPAERFGELIEQDLQRKEETSC